MTFLNKRKITLLALAFAIMLTNISMIPVHAEPDDSTTDTETTEKTPSSNAHLASLSIEGATLNPSFSSQVTGYTAVLLADTTYIIIDATAQDENASIMGTGYFDVGYDDGDQEFVITCEAEDGTVLEYTILVTYNSDPVLTTTLNGETLGFVIKDLDKLKAPDGFTMQEGSFQGSKIITFVNENFDFSLVYLQNETKKADWYCYQDGDVFSPFRTLVINKNKYYYGGVKESDRKIDGYSYGQINVVGEKIYGWKVSNNENKVMMYLYDSVGNGDYYVYDLESQILQNRREFEVGNSKSQRSFFFSPIVIATAIVLIVAIAFLVMIVGSNKKRTFRETFSVLFHRLKNPKAKQANSKEHPDEELVELVRTSKVRIFAHPDEITPKRKKDEKKPQIVQEEPLQQKEQSEVEKKKEVKADNKFKNKANNIDKKEESIDVIESVPVKAKKEKEKKERKGIFNRNKSQTPVKEQEPTVKEAPVLLVEEEHEKESEAVQIIPEVEIPSVENEPDTSTIYEEDPMTEIQKYIDQLFYLPQEKNDKKDGR